MRPFMTSASRFMLLITDGAPTLADGCIGDPPDVVDTQPIIDEIAGAEGEGIRTFIIGSPGSERNSMTGGDMRPWLSRAAMEGGTAAPSCTENGPNYCHMDMTQEPDFAAALTGDIRGLRIGVPRSLLADGVDPQVTAAFDNALEMLEREGASLVEITLPHNQHAVAVYYMVGTAEASSNLARYDGVRYGFRAERSESLARMYERTRDEGFGAEVKRRIMLGTYVLSAGYYDAYYVKAQQVRTLIRRDYEDALTQADVIAMPTSPTPAFPLGERWSLVTSVVTSPCECFVNRLSCPTHRPMITLSSQPARFSRSACDTGLHIGSNVPGRIFSSSCRPICSFGIPDRFEIASTSTCGVTPNARPVPT